MPDIPDKVLVLGLGFVAYYLGIIIRYYGLPGKDSPALPRQFLLGIPFSIAVVVALSSTMEAAVQSATTSATAILATLGLIIEHGMVLNEAAANLDSIFFPQIRD